VSHRYFGGIDFSGAREPLSNLWSAVGEEHAGRLRIRSLAPHPFRADLAHFVTEGWRGAVAADARAPILWGADFPFGLPAAAAEHLPGLRERSWRGVAAWVADRPPDEVRAALPGMAKAGRVTDSGGAMAPLDLRLYRQTVEGIRFLYEIRDGGDVSILPVAPRSDAATVVIEVYPSGTVRDLGLKGSRVPSRPGEVRARPAALRPYLEFEHPSLEQAACVLEDARDAVLACLTAWLCRDDPDQPARLARADPETIGIEGWIFRPPLALAT
jgi:hypothetical protein